MGAGLGAKASQPRLCCALVLRACAARLCCALVLRACAARLCCALVLSAFTEETPPELVPVLGEWREVGGVNRGEHMRTSNLAGLTSSQVGDPGAMYWYNDKLGTSCWKDPRNCFSIHEALVSGTAQDSFSLEMFRVSRLP